MPATPKKCLVVASAAAVLGGCVSSGPQYAVVPRSALVMAAPWDGHTHVAVLSPSPWAAWETGRNDDRLGVGSHSGLLRRELVEVRTRDSRRTVNGRVHETSRTMTRSRRRGLLLTPR